MRHCAPANDLHCLGDINIRSFTVYNILKEAYCTVRCRALSDRTRAPAARTCASGSLPRASTALRWLRCRKLSLGGTVISVEPVRPQRAHHIQSWKPVYGSEHVQMEGHSVNTPKG